MIPLYCLGGVALLLVIAVLGGATYEMIASHQARKKYIDPIGDLITVGERKVHLNITGKRREGQAVVVLESSVGANSLDWQLIQPNVAEHAQVISYDRAGNGWSDAISSQRTPETIVTELHEALTTANIAPPYVLVGHRYGGLYVRKYHELFPEDVAGLILVDSSHPATFDEDNSSEINRLKMNFNVFQRIGIVRYVTRRNYRVSKLPNDRREQYIAMMMHDNANLLQEARPVLENGIDLLSEVDVPLSIVSRGEDEDIARERRWADYQRELLALSPNAKHINAESGSSWIVFAEPLTVANAIIEMVDQVSQANKESE